MRPIATDAVAWSVCLSVGHVREPAKRLNRSRCRLVADSRGPKKPCARRESRSLHGKGQFLFLTGPFKSIGNLCCGARSKRDYLIINNGTTCDAAFRHSFFDHWLLLLLLLLLTYSYQLTSNTVVIISRLQCFVDHCVLLWCVTHMWFEVIHTNY